ncbi:phage tail protein I [Aliivibrio wodanis]|uniref:Phage tail protein I n=1 Tax=Aliivibrio wodanis TaxID=80852 RepID=A0A090IT51_9GAMM|nr:phage tail protein I [Aliivibrio wodanis]
MSKQNEPFISVQPSNRTVIEESLEYAWVNIIEKVVSPYPTLKDPMLCSDDFVALLAAERGVLDWQPNDSLTQQRKTTDKAFEIHSKAGTRKGLIHSIDALGFSSEITKGAQAYSLKISAEIEQGKLDEQLQCRLESRVNTYKSERDLIALDLVRAANVFSYSGALFETGVVSDSVPYSFDGLESQLVMYSAVLFETHTFSDCMPYDPRFDAGEIGQLYLSSLFETHIHSDCRPA